MKKRSAIYFCEDCQSGIVYGSNVAFLCPTCHALLTTIPHHGVSAFDPPNVAEFLLTMLATTRRTEAMVGDLNERFNRERREFGCDRAVRLYWARTLRSLPGLVWRAIGKVVIGAAKRIFRA